MRQPENSLFYERLGAEAVGGPVEEVGGLVYAVGVGGTVDRGCDRLECVWGHRRKGQLGGFAEPIGEAIVRHT
ncbi:hypothetical protein SRABI128_05505 [Microbacterium sp. Bi128]|nr:hypothetical protein SRABI128_05505 [Microbacterium sp. Bi128]